MISQVNIENFRCFPTLSVELKPLTVLIGPNDSGKSAFLAALLATFGSWSRDRTDAWRCDLKRRTYLAAQVGPKLATVIADSRPQGQAQRVPLRLELYRPPSRGFPFLGPGFADADGVPVMDEDGKNLPALLDFTLRHDRRRFEAYHAELKAVIPGFDDLIVATPKPETRRIELKLEQGLELPAENVSVGVRAMMFYLALAYHPKPPDVILIEEPENGLHPARLGEVMAVLRSITKGEHCGRAAQVIMTTHSPYLLDQVDPATDQVLVFRRNDDGSRTADPLDVNRVRGMLDISKLGEVWSLVTEQGLVAAKP